MAQDTPSCDHFVLISLDTLRSDCIGANPYKLWPDKYDLPYTPRTPLLDELVATGTFFPNCISTAPYTSAAHASIFTGKWPLRHGVFEFFNRSLRSTTLFSHARRLGYHTYFKTDFPIILGPHLGLTTDVDDYIIEEEDEYLEKLDIGGKTFSFVHFGGLHIPYGFHNLRFGGSDYIERLEALEAETGKPGEVLGDRLVETYRSGEDLELLLRYKRVVQHYYEREHYDRLFQLYLEGVTHFMRTRFEPFFERLAAKLQGRRALFVVFGDHGEEYDATAYGHFNSLAEGVIRVPVIFWGEDVHVSMQPTRIRSVDLAPTIIAALQLRPQRSMDGHSLASTVFAGSSYPRRPAFAQAYTSDTQQFVSFQQRLLAKGRKTGSLPHVCYLEGVYDDDYKLRQQNYRYSEAAGVWSLTPCAPSITLERIDHDLRLHPVDDQGIQAALLGKLADYRALARGQETTAPIIAVPDHVREQLQGMGYDV